MENESTGGIGEFYEYEKLFIESFDKNKIGYI